MIAHARVLAFRVRLSVYSSTTTLAPKMAYSSSRLTHGTVQPATVTGLGGRRVERHKHRIQGRGGLLAAALAGGGGPLPDGLGLRAGMPRAWRVNALCSDGQVVPSSRRRR
jgi:hypothetical protein